MKLKDMTIEELETLSYADLAYLILKENNKSMNTPSVFKEICKLLGISDEEYSAKIGDFYTSLMDDEDDEEEALDEESEDIEDSNEEIEEDIDTQVDDDDIVDDDDDLDDLAIVDEDEELGEN